MRPQGRPHRQPEGMKVSVLYLVFSGITLAECWGTSLQPEQDGSLGSPLGLCWCECRWGYSFFWGIWLEYKLFCLKVSVLPGCSFLGLLTRETAGFCWGLLLFFSPIGISELPASSVPNLGYVGQKENLQRGFPGGAVVKNPPANAGDTGSSPGLGRAHIPLSN